MPHSEWGTQICALLSWAGPEKVNSQELKIFFEKQLPSYKCPKIFYETIDFPRTNSGKIKRSELSKRAQQGAYPVID